MSFSTNFVPSSQIVSDITQANPGVVTTVANHGYVNGIQIRMILPVGVGMQQLNGQVFTPTILSNNSFSLNTDTSYFDVYNDAGSLQASQVIPVGEIATTLTMLEKNNGNILPEL